MWDVLAAARTKWNFLPFEPGLVGGHCIGVDPYYLSHLAQQLGHNPQVILSGRETNDDMGKWIADAIHERRGHRAGRALVLGLTFKENVPDLRNSRVFDLMDRLKELGYAVDAADPIADPLELKGEYGTEMASLDEQYDLVVGAGAHDAYRRMPDEELQRFLKPGGTLADVKNMWRDRKLDAGIVRWGL